MYLITEKNCCQTSKLFITILTIIPLYTENRRVQSTVSAQLCASLCDMIEYQGCGLNQCTLNPQYTYPREYYLIYRALL